MYRRCEIGMLNVKDNYTRKAKVVNIVDGDTIDVEIDLGFHATIKERVRLLRVNCPEKFGETKEEGLRAKEFATKELLGKEISLITHKTDSFKRWLGEVYYMNDNNEVRNFSNELLRNGYAVEFMV